MLCPTDGQETEKSIFLQLFFSIIIVDNNNKIIIDINNDEEEDMTKNAA